MAAKNEIVESIAALDKIADEYALTTCLASVKERFKQAIMISSGIKRLRKAMTDEVLAQIMDLQGSGLGFLTDKDKTGGYKPAEVRDCMIEAVLRGAMPCGNEINIISARPYFTKAYFERILRQFPGLTNLKVLLSVPKLQDGRMVVKAECSWKLNNVPDSLSLELPIKVNQGMGDDAILGKARRKALAQIYAQITGSPLADADVEEAALKPANIIEETPPTKTAALKQKLKTRALPKPEPKDDPAPEVEEEVAEEIEEDIPISDAPEDPSLVVGKIAALDADPQGDFMCFTIGTRDIFSKDAEIIEFATNAFDENICVEARVGDKNIIEEIRSIED